jgi:phosphoribosylglycinamide formyltransferase-1
MHVGIITYQTGHLKTWQMMRRLLTQSHRITLFAFPFKKRVPGTGECPSRYTDRPFQLIDLDVQAFCRAQGVGYVAVGGWEPEFASRLGQPGDLDTPDVFLHCTAKIVPRPFLEGRTILNCHPGLLPHNRGVDAFKWAIVNKWPVGVTLHILDEAIDRGTILARMRIPVLSRDSLTDVWQRTYDFEGDLLGHFERYIGNRAHGWHVGDDHPCSHARIPADLDRRIEAVFLANREELVRLATDLNAQAHPADVVLDAPRLSRNRP